MYAKPEEVIETGRRRRRLYTEQFKAEAIGACQQAGVSVAAVALARGLNATMLHKWVRRAERGNAPIAIRPTMPSEQLGDAASFVPMMLPSNPTASTIRVEIQRKAGRVCIEWPASAAHECALLLRDLIK